VTFETLFARAGLGGVDLLQIDTEGFDLEVLRLFDVGLRRPAIINFEQIHLSGPDREEAVGLLSAHGYDVTMSHWDALGVRMEDVG
jgi:hypothetical protein